MVYYLFKVALLSSTHLTDHTLLMEGCPGPPGDCQSLPELRGKMSWAVAAWQQLRVFV